MCATLASPVLRSNFSFQEPLAALEAFDAPPLLAGVSSIDDEFRSRIHDVEKKNLQLECGICLLLQEVGDLHRANSRPAVENRVQQQETDALPKWHGELAARFAQAQSRLDEATRRILQELGTFGKQNYLPHPQKQFPCNNRGEMPASSII